MEKELIAQTYKVTVVINGYTITASEFTLKGGEVSIINGGSISKEKDNPMGQQIATFHANNIGGELRLNIYNASTEIDICSLINQFIAEVKG